MFILQVQRNTFGSDTSLTIKDFLTTMILECIMLARTSRRPQDWIPSFPLIPMWIYTDWEAERCLHGTKCTSISGTVPVRILAVKWYYLQWLQEYGCWGILGPTWDRTRWHKLKLYLSALVVEGSCMVSWRS